MDPSIADVLRLRHWQCSLLISGCDTRIRSVQYFCLVLQGGRSETVLRSIYAWHHLGKKITKACGHNSNKLASNADSPIRILNANPRGSGFLFRSYIDPFLAYNSVKFFALEFHVKQSAAQHPKALGERHNTARVLRVYCES